MAEPLSHILRERRREHIHSKSVEGPVRVRERLYSEEAITKVKGSQSTERLSCA